MLQPFLLPPELPETELMELTEYAMSFADPIGDLANMQKPVHVVVTDKAS